MSYFDLYLSMCEFGNNKENEIIYPIEDIYELFKCKLSVDDDFRLLELLTCIFEDGFNLGFEFAMRIFLNNL